MVAAPHSAFRDLLSAWDGVVTAPVALNQARQALDPTKPETWLDSLRAAAEIDFGDVQRRLADPRDIPQTEAVLLARRIGWTINALTGWRPPATGDRLELELILASLAVWDPTGAFWPSAEFARLKNRALMPGLEAVLQGRVMSPHIPADAPIWEREQLEALLAAEQAADWSNLGARGEPFKRLPTLDGGAQQAAMGLATRDRPRMIRLLDQSASWWRAHALLAPLPLADILGLAVASRSGLARFAALEMLVRAPPRPLSAREEAGVRNLLLVLAYDGESWEAWLSRCNRFPVRHPHLQMAMARALARLDVQHLKAYVRSVELRHSDDDTRLVVTLCLTAFRTQATASQRRKLWRLIFERWQAWNFDAEDDKGLTAIGYSAFDYGVVGWLVEGEPPESSEALERSFEDDFRALELAWHPSFNSAISAFFRRLSRHQVFAHAVSQTDDSAEWLPGGTIYTPRAARDAFVQRRYNLDSPDFCDDPVSADSGAAISEEPNGP